ncbi:MAG: alpha/beta fold hydrolase [Capsulimonadales bacterium]|nr:alpha/beta fold hydrolase [Capsulimonadales bacterium]
MRSLQSFPWVRTALFCLLAVPMVTGLRMADLVADEPKAGTIAPVAGPITRGGVTYVSDTRVNATVTPRFDPKSPPPQALTYGVRYESVNGETVTGDLVLPTAVTRNGKKAPTILLLHGLGGKKEDVSLLGIALANRGYVSFAIDIAGHGARRKPAAKPLADLDPEETRTLIGQTLADLHRAIDFLSRRSEVDTDRLGFVGCSLGGIVGGVFLGDEPRIRSAVLWSAGGDWARLMTSSSHPFARKYRTPGTDRERIAGTMADVEPLTCIRRFRGPTLHLYGKTDTVVPVACIEELFAATPNPKKKVVYPGGHIPDPLSMIGETVKWFDSSLKAVTGTGA